MPDRPAHALMLVALARPGPRGNAVQSTERAHREQFRKMRSQHYKLDGAAFRRELMAGNAAAEDDDDDDDDE